MAVSAKGASAPFSLALQLPGLRDDALLQRALHYFAMHDVVGALLDAESACRRNPRSHPPALLRSELLHRSASPLAAKAIYLAWCREPTHEGLQNALIQSLVASGAHDVARTLGLCFLPERARAGSAASLVEMLTGGSLGVYGACWPAQDAIFLVAYWAMNSRANGEILKKSEQVELVGERETISVHVPVDGTPVCIHLPQSAGVWSVVFAGDSQKQTRLQGSPLVFRAATRQLSHHRGASMPALKFAHKRTAGARLPVQVVIPVYAGLAQIRACLTSVMDSLGLNRTRVGITVVDDASPDSELASWLDTVAAEGAITLVRNRHNLGFIESCNRVLSTTRDADVLLLNSDTLVHGNWIDRLSDALCASDDIASVTPWSNNGEVTSFPTIAKVAPLPSPQQLGVIDSVASVLHTRRETVDIDIPTGCGFAMLMRRGALDRVGLLDGVALKRGYSEEVDWCLRASALGYRHRLATGVFVAHAGTATFGYEKTLRVAQNRVVIQSRYPLFYDQYRQFVSEDPLQGPRSVLAAGLVKAGCSWFGAQNSQAEKRVEIPEHLPAPLATRTHYIGIWRYDAATPGAFAVLALARAIASRPSHLPNVRLLVFGTPTEALWHTGVVHALPQVSIRDQGLLSDSVLLGLSGCKTLLSETAMATPADISFIKLDSAFEPQRWLSRWLLQVERLAQHSEAISQ